MVIWWGVVATLISSLILGSGNSPTSSLASGGLSASAAEEPVPSVISLPIGLSGTITSDILVSQLTENGEETVFLGTSAGLYIIANGSLQRFIFSPSPITNIALLEDVTGDEGRDIVVSLLDTYIPNLRSYDGASGEEIWHFAATQQALVENLGWAEVQTLPADLEVVEDVNSDGFQEVALTSGRRLYLLSGKTGKLLWKYEADNELRQIARLGDINGDGVGELATGSPKGFIYVLSGREGKLLWQKRVAEKVTTEYGQVLEPSIGDILSLPIGGRERIVVSSQEGKVRLLDLTSSAVDWQASVSSVADSARLQLGLSPDVNGDGVREILTYRETGYQGSLILLNSATGEQIWQRELSLESPAHIDTAVLNDQSVVLVPLGRSGFRERVAVLDIGTGGLRQTVEITSAPESSTLAEERWVKGLEENSFLLVSNRGDLLRLSSQGEVLWHYPGVDNIALTQGKFTPDAVPDLLILSTLYNSPFSGGRELGGGGNSPSPSFSAARILSVRDGATSQEMWRYEVPYAEFIASGGIKGLKVVPDLNQDGAEDIIGYQGSAILAFSGRDGSRLFQLSREEALLSLDVMRNGEGIVFISAIANDISIVDREGGLLWSQSSTSWDEKTIPQGVSFRVLEDLNEDGVSDLALFFPDKLIIAGSAREGDNLIFTPGVTLEAAEGGSIRPGEVIADLDGDGWGEISLLRQQQEQSSLVVLSPLTGEILLELEQEGDPLVNLAAADFNGDGYQDSLAYWRWGKGQVEDVAMGDYRLGITSAELEILSGKDGGILGKFPFAVYPRGEVIPATPVADLSGDGIADLAVHQISSFGDEVIAIYDIAQSRLLKEIAVTPPRERYGLPSPFKSSEGIPGEEVWLPGGLIAEVGDFSGDGKKEVAVFQSAYRSQFGVEWGYIPPDPGGGAEAQHPVIVDIARGQMVARFLLSGAELEGIDRGSQVGMIGAQGSFYLLHPANSLRLLSPAEGGTPTSPLPIRWEGTSPGNLALVVIDGILSGLTYEKEITLPVGRGSHQLTLYSLDKYGRVAQATVNFVVPSQSRALFLASLVLLLLLLSLFSPRIMSVVARRRRSGRPPCEGVD